MSEEKKQSVIRGFTPRVTCGPWPKVYEAESFQGGRAVYKVRIVAAKAVLEKFIEQAHQVADQALADARAGLEKDFADAKTGKDKGKAKEALAKLEAADLPWKPVYDDDGNETDEVIIQFKAPATYKDKKGVEKPMRPPVVVDRHGKKLAKQVNFGNGSEIIVAYEMRPFYTAAVGAGVSLRLTGVQLLKVVEGGGYEPKFGEQEGDDIDFPAEPETQAAGGDSDDATTF